MNWVDYEKSCYYLARNQEDYLKDGSFNERIQNLIASVPQEEMNDAIAVMEQMVSHGELYQLAEQQYAPILIYKSEPVCFGVLNYFADCMGEELRKLGQEVVYFDSNEQPLENLIPLAQKKYKAILGFQSYLFSVTFEDGSMLHDIFDAPCYNMQFDHPVVAHPLLLKTPKDYTVLTHDRNYKAYIEKYYGLLAKAKLLPPAGGICQKEMPKEYDISFVGYFHDWRNWQDEIKAMNHKYKGVARRLVYQMKHHPNQTYEEAMEKVLAKLSLEAGFEEKRNMLYECKVTYYCVMYYYRRKVMHAILSAGIQVDVFSHSWNTSEWRAYPNLICHDSLTPEECLKVYAKSKVSINIMSWHKDGMTERIANMMLCGSVVLSDKSTYLEENFTREEAVLFDLEELEKLPQQIRALFANEKQIASISEHAKAKALLGHTWEHRAAQFLQLLQENVPIQNAAKKPCRILAITHQLSMTGAPLVLFDMLRIYQQNGCKIEVLGMLEGPLREKLENCGIKVYVEEHLWENRRHLQYLAKDFDLVIANTLLAYEGMHSLAGERVPVLWWIHEGEQYFEYFKTVLPDMSKLASNIHPYAVSPYVQNIFKKRLGCEIPVLPFGVTDDTKHRALSSVLLETCENKIKFLSAGIYSDVKAQDVLVQAIRNLPESYRNRMEFYFCGNESKADARILAMVRELSNACENVHILGELQREDVLALMKTLDCTIVSSRVETVSAVAIETMMNAKPVICTDQCGISYYLKDGENGFVVPINDACAITQKIMDIADGKYDLVELGRQARLTYEQNFTEEIVTQIYQDLLEVLITN